MIKLIALDMDGTVLNTEHNMSERNIAAIKAAQAEGIEVMISTGRGYKDGMIPVNDANLTLAFSALNGAELRDDEGEIMSSNPISSDNLLEVLHILDENKIFYDVYIGDQVYTESLAEQIKIFIESAKAMNFSKEKEILASLQERTEQGLIVEVDSIDPIITEHKEKVYKLLAISDDLEKLDAVAEKLRELKQIAVSSSLVGNLEINSVHAQKGVALEKYTTLKGIPLENTMVIGDNYNDVSMMKVAGLAVAMGNAPDEVKEICDEVTLTNAEDGVAVAIEKVLGKVIITE